MPTNPEDIKVVSSPRKDIAALAASAFWTEQKIRDAEPIPLEIEETRQLLSQEPWVAEGPALEVKTQPPEGGVASDVAPYTAAAPFDTRLVPQRSILPYCTVGKLYMTFNGRNYVGSAWVIAQRAVFTAGHCVFSKDEGGWADNILFIPQYDDGTAPVGRWSGTQIHSLQGWTQREDFKYDMGVFVTDRPIRPSTGSLGWMANFPPNQGPFRSIGYPAQPISGYNFNGQKMWNSVGPYINGANPIQMHNNMTGGAAAAPGSHCGMASSTRTDLIVSATPATRTPCIHLTLAKAW